MKKSRWNNWAAEWHWKCGLVIVNWCTLVEILSAVTKSGLWVVWGKISEEVIV